MGIRYSGSMKQLQLRQVTVTNIPTDPPVWQTSAGIILTQNEGTAVNTSVIASDPQGSLIVYSLASGSLPAGLSLSNTGSITGTLPRVTGTTPFVFTIDAANQIGSTPREFEIDVTNQSTAPVWVTDAGLIATGDELTTINATVLATHIDNATVTYAVNSGTLPGSVTLNANTGTLTGTLPAVVSDTSYTFTLAATAEGLSTNRSFTINAVNVPVAPSWANVNSALINYAGAVVGFDRKAIEPEGTTTTYSIISGSLPDGITMSNVAHFTGNTNYLENGAYSVANFTVNAVTTEGKFATKTFNYSLQNDTFANTTVVAVNGQGVDLIGNWNFTYFGTRGYSTSFPTLYGPGSWSIGGSEGNRMEDIGSIMNFGNQSFTIDGWFRPDGHTIGQIQTLFYVGNTTVSGTAGASMITEFKCVDTATNTCTVTMRNYNAAGTQLFNYESNNVVIPPQEWTHFAFSKSGTTLRIFVNGTQVGSATHNVTIPHNTTHDMIMGYALIGGAENPLNGYAESLRVNIGTAPLAARYTANFTPPGALVGPPTAWVSTVNQSFASNSVTNVALVASNTSSYTLTSGSVPDGMTFYSNGRIIGTATTPETVNATIRANNSGSGPSVSRTFNFRVYNPTVLLLHMEDTLVSNTLVDSSSNGNNLLITGGGAVSTVQEKFGSQSYLSTNANQITTATAADPFGMQFGTGDFTIETFFYATGVGSAGAGSFGSAICNLTFPGSSDGFDFSMWLGGNAGGTAYTSVGFAKRNSGGTFFTSATGTFTLNQWRHVAVTRQSGVIRFFSNGTLLTTVIGSGTPSSNMLVTPGSKFELGSFGGTTQGGGNTSAPKWIGYLDEFRITNGLARYTASFTPTTSAFPDNA